MFNDASLKLKKFNNFKTGNQFTEGIPISAIVIGYYSIIPNICYVDSKYYICAHSWSSTGSYGTLFIYSETVNCIVYYI